MDNAPLTTETWLEDRMMNHTRGAILVGVDESLNANIAAAWAADIGRSLGVPIRAVAAWTRLVEPALHGIDDHISEMGAYAADIATRSLHGAGIDDIDVTGVRGPVCEALLDTAKQLDASMLVVGTRGLGPLAGLLLGSVSRRLLFATDRPLVLVPAQTTLTPPALTRILIGVDCSPIARRVLTWSSRLCADLGVPVTIVRCADPGCEKPPGHVERFDDRVEAEMDEALEPFHERAIECKVRIAHCDPRVGILESAAGDGAGLIVIGKRGAGQFSGLGGTASYLVRHSPLPLAVIP